MIELNQEEFATLAICAMRYAKGRSTYMPGWIVEIIEKHLKDMNTFELNKMMHEFEMPYMGAPESSTDRHWLHLWSEIRKEQERRKKSEKIHSEKR